MKTMNLNEFFTNKVIYKDTPLKLKEKLEQEISQASLKKKLVLANALSNMVFAKIDNENAPKILISRLMCKFSPIDYESTIPSDFRPIDEEEYEDDLEWLNEEKEDRLFDYYLFLNGVKESDLIEVVSESIETYDECMIEIAQNILKDKFSYDIDLLQVLVKGYAKEIMEFLNNELTKESFKELLVSKRIN
ncbi:hypothetical protein VQW74_04695 [Helicobacter pylori]|uniref:Uncharacterized protein n=2 Tax=Helicobacter pylori TaxID=210 RepID=A0AB33Z5T8_HELPX|nr:hypothetical protein [Helicobacter pylori]AGL69081.1 hypothetical protein K750_00590 [Helicobacter pylori UM037]EQK94233.1 hypothetical protein N198_01810 [Helicobacter pylori UM037]